jgi:hypothetical protein
VSFWEKILVVTGEPLQGHENRTESFGGDDDDETVLIIHSRLGRIRLPDVFASVLLPCTKSNDPSRHYSLPFVAGLHIGNLP